MSSVVSNPQFEKFEGALEAGNGADAQGYRRGVSAGWSSSLAFVELSLSKYRQLSAVVPCCRPSPSPPPPHRTGDASSVAASYCFKNTPRASSKPAIAGPRIRGPCRPLWKDLGRSTIGEHVGAPLEGVPGLVLVGVRRSPTPGQSRWRWTWHSL